MTIAWTNLLINVYENLKGTSINLLGDYGMGPNTRVERKTTLYASLPDLYLIVMDGLFEAL